MDNLLQLLCTVCGGALRHRPFLAQLSRPQPAQVQLVSPLREGVLRAVRLPASFPLRRDRHRTVRAGCQGVALSQRDHALRRAHIRAQHRPPPTLQTHASATAAAHRPKRCAAGARSASRRCAKRSAQPRRQRFARSDHRSPTRADCRAERRRPHRQVPSSLNLAQRG